MNIFTRRFTCLMHTGSSRIYQTLLLIYFFFVCTVCQAVFTDLSLSSSVLHHTRHKGINYPENCSSFCTLSPTAGRSFQNTTLQFVRKKKKKTLKFPGQIFHVVLFVLRNGYNNNNSNQSQKIIVLISIAYTNLVGIGKGSITFQQNYNFHH